MRAAKLFSKQRTQFNNVVGKLNSSTPLVPMFGPSTPSSHTIPVDKLFFILSSWFLSLPTVSTQALWRGHRSRRLNDNPKVVKLRRRLRQVSAGLREEDKLCNKTSSALDYLLRYKHFSYILEALKNLGKEIATNNFNSLIISCADNKAKHKFRVTSI